MKKLMSLLVAAVFAVSSGVAVAASHAGAPMKKDEMKKEASQSTEKGRERPCLFLFSLDRRLLRARLAFGDFLVHHRHVEFPALGDDLLERRTRKRARLREENDLLAEKHQGRDRADIERRGQVLLIVGVHFSKHDVGVLFRTGLEYRREAFARPAPRRPEIDEDHVVTIHDLFEIVLGQRDRCHAKISGICRSRDYNRG